VRKPIMFLLLPLLMLLSQQGALWHEISHLADGRAPSHERREQPIDRLCQQCLGYAQLAAAATPFVPPLLLLEAHFARPQADALPWIAADAPSARSRGPPAFA
jgi:hypothetical protein